MSGIVLRAAALSALAAFVSPGGADAQPGGRPLDRDGLAPLQEAARELAREVGYLQEDIVADLKGRKELTLYTEADAVLGRIAEFRRALKVGAARGDLYDAFEALDRKLHDLLGRVEALGPEQRLLQRSAARVGDADEALHRALAAGGATEPRTRVLLQRQARVLAASARRLGQTAQYALGLQTGRAVLFGELGEFAEAADRLRKSVDDGADRDRLRSEFTAVTRTWGAVARELEDLRPAEHVYLLQEAARIDRLHEMLYRLLGVEGERRPLRIRT